MTAPMAFKTTSFMPVFDLPWLETMMRANLVRDWMKGVTAYASILGGLGPRWTSGYLHFLGEVTRASSPEERLKAQEAWLRTALNLCLDCTTEIDNAALATAKETALDMAQTFEADAIASAASVP